MTQKNKEITYEDQLIASTYNIENLPAGLNFLTKDENFIQVGTWNYKKDTKLEAHYHNYFERSSFRTQEVVIVLDGKIQCNLYTEEGKFIDSVELEKNNIIIQFQGVHEYITLEDSKVLEVKNGPYFGPEKDRTRIEVEEN